MNQFKKTISFVILIALSFQSCKNSNATEETNLLAKTENKAILETSNNNLSSEEIDKIIDNYALSLSTEKIKFVDSVDCRKTEQNIENYSDGIYVYEYVGINHNSIKGKISGDYNGDGITDYIANYTCDNCWAGNGAGNYLSNCFFLTGSDSGIKVDETTTINFKQKLIEVITKDFGNTYFKKPEKEIMINGLVFTEIKDQKVYGTFNINTEKCKTAQACFYGTFEYDVKNNLLKMTEEKS